MLQDSDRCRKNLKTKKDNDFNYRSTLSENCKKFVLLLLYVKMTVASAFAGPFWPILTFLCRYSEGTSAGSFINFSVHPSILLQ
jgi:hypothetical protein